MVSLYEGVRVSDSLYVGYGLVIVFMRDMG